VSASRYHVLLVASHPVQYASPQFRLMAQHPRLDVQVAYCSLHGAKPGMDQEMWSPRWNLDAFVTAVERAVVLRRETA